MERVPATCTSNEYGGASDHCKDSHGVETGLSQGLCPYDRRTGPDICGEDNNMHCRTD